MKRRILTFSLALSLMVIPVGATTDTNALSYATLDSMGVLDGFSASLTSPLTRGQFCDMLVSITSNGSLLSTTSTRSPFSDVTPAHWASSQINLIYQLGYLNGNGDGTFAPDRTITLAEAITAVLRVLGYSTAQIGYAWPQDYIAAANSLGLLDGISADVSYNLTYGDGIQLLYAMVNGDTQSGKSYLSTLGSGTVTDAVIVEADGDTVTLYSGNGLSYFPQGSDFSDAIIGTCVGTLLLSDSGNAIGFVPNDTAQTTLSIASVSSSGITTTSGGTISIPSSATLLIGGTKTTFGLGYYQMDSYSSAVLCYSDTGAVSFVLPQSNGQTSEASIVGYYDSAYPNTTNPETIQVAGATLSVNESVSFSGIALGEKIAVTVDASSQVVAVTTSSSATSEYMIGILGNNSITLTSGITISGDISSTAQTGQLVRVTSSSSGKLTAYAASSSTGSSFDLVNKTLGSYPLSSNVIFYECVGNSAVERIYTTDFNTDTVAASDIRYYHLNSNGNVDIILFNNITGNLYDYGLITTGTITTNSGTSLGSVTNKTVAITNSEGTSKSVTNSMLAAFDGQMGALISNSSGELIDGFALTLSGTVDRSAFDGLTSVMTGGERYSISDSVQVYYEPTDSWMSLESAKAMATTFNLYCDKGNIIRVILAQ